MQIIVPFEGRVLTVIQSSCVAAKRQPDGQYSLSGDDFQMDGIREGQVLLFPDDVQVAPGQELTEAQLARAQPFDNFITVSAEEALPNALGLLLRLAVADGRVTDAELLAVQPALEGRAWMPGLSVQPGDVYTYAGSLWRCLQAHVTQADWAPDVVPALWHKVEVLTEGATRVWQAGIAYVIGDVLAYPDADSPQYECLQAHTSQAGWEPPNVPALWKLKA